jgi:4'-phosphopantetheinyl transferase
VSDPLGAGEAHLWEVTPALAEHARAALYPLLSEEERRRASRFKRAADERTFTCVRGALRTILSVYAAASPERLEIHEDAFGRPLLRAAPPLSPLFFSVSHTEGRALVAVSRERCVGVDVERLRDDLDHDKIAVRFFSARERSLLARLAGEERRRAFYRCWTRKEAYVKALGKGLTIPLDRFHVSVGPGEAALLDVDEDRAEAARWRLFDIDVGDRRFAAALALRSPGARVQRIRWGGPADGI